MEVQKLVLWLTRLDTRQPSGGRLGRSKILLLFKRERERDRERQRQTDSFENIISLTLEETDVKNEDGSMPLTLGCEEA